MPVDVPIGIAGYEGLCLDAALGAVAAWQLCRKNAALPAAPAHSASVRLIS
jgi:hypothetical protein